LIKADAAAMESTQDNKWEKMNRPKPKRIWITWS
jgi:hypothetical protein